MYRINNPKSKFIFIKSKGKEKMESSPLKEIASELPFFKTVDEREKLLGVVGALVLRQVSLSKAAEIMGMGKEAFLELLDAMRVEFSYLEKSDVETEVKW
jgi:predicted HTH domain antitoxin